MRAICFLLALCQLGITVVSLPDVDDTEMFPASGTSNSSVDNDFLNLSADADVSSPHALFARQRRCPYPIMCGADWCCPANTICCSQKLMCCRSGSVCRPEVGGCCPLTSETCGGRFCAPPGSVCCSSHACPSGYQCNELGGPGACCRVGQVKCAGGCCPAGTTCASTPGYCNRPRPSQRPSSKPTPTPSKTVSRQQPSRTQAQSKTPSQSACRVEIDGRANVPTFTVPYQETMTTLPFGNGKRLCLDNRELMNSMCKGMKKNKNCDTERMKLTYKPKNSKQNRKNMCPNKSSKKYCASEDVECDPSQPNKGCNPYAYLSKSNFWSMKHNPFKLTCDEFPFANSAEGGKPGSGTSICVPGWQNSFQGGKLNQIGKQLSDGQSYIIQVTGWDCKSGKPKAGMSNGCAGMRKREEIGGREITEADMFRNFTSNGEHAVMLYLGDVDPGTYSYKLNIGNGVFTEFTVIDGTGEELYSLPNGLKADSNPQTVTFTIDESAEAVSLWGYTKDTKISLSYNMTETSGSTATAAPSGTAPPASNAAKFTTCCYSFALTLLTVLGVMFSL